MDNMNLSPPVYKPTYSALLQQNLDRNLSLRNAVSDPSKNPPEEIFSPSPPVYKSTKLMNDKGSPKSAFSFDGVKVEDDGETISHRQMGKQNSPAPPPPPPPPPPPLSTTAASADQEKVGSADVKEGGEEKKGDAVSPGEETQSDDEEDKTAL
ncbi:hypothetical protein BV898_07893 [Hypsibius exemplaris]|uniref:Uncharacterized protein n=1 Tax=Hypsibius exemplaris TaxID=2072580 RepID=A0A1W0WRY8_HYPEX|nr:hypothetical protein BV898_07893 [Hypsibius exemplaris]